MPGVKKRSQPCAWRVVPTLFTCGLVLVPACSEIHKGHQAQAEQHWKEVRAKVKFQLARQQYESGLVEDAASSVSEALALDPFCADYHVLLARCRLEQGQVMSAERTIELAAGLDADSSELAYVRGIIAERRGQFEQALEFFQKKGYLQGHQQET